MRTRKLFAALVCAALLCTGVFCACSGGTSPSWLPGSTTESKGNEATGASAASDGPAAHTSSPTVPEPAPSTSPANSETASGAPTPDNTPTGEPLSTPAPAEFSVRDAAWTNVEWVQYSSPYFTLTVPKDWKVQWNGDANALEWMASTEDFTVGIYNQDHGYAAKDPRMASSLGFSMSMTSGTVKEYFETRYANTTEYFTVKNARVPDNLNLIQAARPYTPIRDYQSLYAVFKDANIEAGEGIYSAVVMESQDVWFNGYNYGAWEVNCILSQWSPFGEFVNWAPVLARIAQSFAYTEYYIRQWQSIAQSVLQPDSGVSDTDPVMEAFEERSRSDTILQEKRSDMIGEYERVYDNETGNIYRAYNGFLEDIGTEQKRYSAITENQYADGYVGWIDKQ